MTSEIKNEQIVIDAIDSKEITSFISMSQSTIWNLRYKYIISFKDNKIKFSPIFKELVSPDYTTLALNGTKIPGVITGLYNPKGKCLKPKIIPKIEECTNQYVENFTIAISENISEDW